MPWLRDDFFYEMDKFHRSLRRALRLGEEITGQFRKWMPEGLQGPPAEVYDEGKRVRLLLEAPGLGKEPGMKWAHRVMGRQLILRGVLSMEQSVRSRNGRFYSERRNEQFLKSIPLPAPVRRKPVSVRYRNGLLEMVFDKQDGVPDGRWYEFDVRSGT